MVLSFAEFGSSDPDLYRLYLISSLFQDASGFDASVGVFSGERIRALQRLCDDILHGVESNIGLGLRSPEVVGEDGDLFVAPDGGHSGHAKVLCGGKFAVDGARDGVENRSQRDCFAKLANVGSFPEERRDGAVGRVSDAGVIVKEVYSLPRGPHYERNKENRMRKKNAKQTRAFSDAGSSGISISAGCSAEIGAELRDSRAKLLILENKRKAIEEQRKLDDLQSPMQVVRDAMDYVNMAQRYKKMTGSSVAAWAASLLEEEAENVARRSVGVRAYTPLSSFDGVSDSSNGLKARTFGKVSTNIDNQNIEKKKKKKPYVFEHEKKLTMDDVKRWLFRYSYLEGKVFPGSDLEEKSKICTVSVSELKKFLLYKHYVENGLDD